MYSGKVRAVFNNSCYSILEMALTEVNILPQIVKLFPDNFWTFLVFPYKISLITLFVGNYQLQWQNILPWAQMPRI